MGSRRYHDQQILYVNLEPKITQEGADIRSLKLGTQVRRSPSITLIYKLIEGSERSIVSPSLLGKDEKNIKDH